MPSPTLTIDDLAQPRQLELLLDDDSSLLSEGYSKVTSTRSCEVDNILLYARPYEKISGVREYLAVGSAPVPAEDMYTVLLDAEYRLDWDNSCAEHKLIQTYDAPDGVQHSQNYWVVKYPFPLARRDYVYERMSSEEDTPAGRAFYLVTNASQNESIPEKKHVRVVDSSTAYCLRPATSSTGQPFCQFVYYMVDDPRGNLPKPIINFLTSRTLPSVLAGLYDATQKYSKSSG